MASTVLPLPLRALSTCSSGLVFCFCPPSLNPGDAITFLRNSCKRACEFCTLNVPSPGTSKLRKSTADSGATAMASSILPTSHLRISLGLVSSLRAAFCTD